MASWYVASEMQPFVQYESTSASRRNMRFWNLSLLSTGVMLVVLAQPSRGGNPTVVFGHAHCQ